MPKMNLKRMLYGSIFLLATACSKKESSVPPPSPPKQTTFYTISYKKVSNFFDLNVRKNTDTAITVVCAIRNQGAANFFYMTPAGSPSWISASPGSVHSGPVGVDSTYAASFTLHINAPDTGTFPLNILISPQYGGQGSMQDTMFSCKVYVR